MIVSSRKNEVMHGKVARELSEKLYRYGPYIILTLVITILILVILFGISMIFATGLR